MTTFWQFNPYTIPLFIGSFLSFVIAMFAWGKTYVNGNRAFTLVMLSLTTWMFGYALELSLVPYEAKLFWAKAQYLGISTAAVLWLIFLLEYSGRSRWLTRFWLALLLLIPSITSIVIWVRPELIWSLVTYDVSGPVSIFKFEYGPWFLIHVAFSYTAYLIDTLLLAEIALRSPQLDRRRGAVLWLGALVPWLSNILYLAGIEPFQGLDLTPFALATMGLAVAWSIFQFRLLDISTVAHHAVINGLPDGVVTVDLRDYITSTNPAAERLFGRKNDEVRERHIQTLIPPKWWERVERTPPGSNRNFEVEESNDDDTQYYDLRIAPIYDRRDRLSGRVLIFRNVTGSKRAQIELSDERASLAQRVTERTREIEAANEELARVAQLKDEFLASMSHELRTPLNAIIGTSEALKEKIYGPITNSQFRSLGRVEESAQHLLALINDILDVSKIESGEFDVNLQSILVADVCKASIRLVKANALKKDIRISASMAATTLKIMADDRRVKQVLVNLLSNAIKFTPEGGKIGLTVTEDIEARETFFAVWDTGIGISAEDQSRLFQPFVQLDSSLSRRHEGTGLGLALSRRLVELHGGTIKVHSQPGKGSRFTVSLPWEGRQRAKTSTADPLDVTQTMNLPTSSNLLTDEYSDQTVYSPPTPN